MTVVEFPGKTKHAPLPIKDVELIGFVTTDDRDLFIDKPEDVQKLMAFIVREKIVIMEEK